MSKELQRILGIVRLGEVMRSPVVTIGEGESLSAAAEKFSAYNVSHLIVVNADKKVAGIVSPKYLYKTQSPRRILSEQVLYHPGMIVDGETFYERDTLDAYRLKDVMRANPQTLRRGQTMVEAIQIMAKYNLGCVPIVDRNNRPVGIITDREIINYAASILS